MGNDMLRSLRASAWDCYVAGMLAFRTHPGQSRGDAKPLTLDEIYQQADDVLRARDQRFGDGT